MKKLNRKGFTLVELLAVIVILAIVVGITLVTVLPTLSSARVKAFESAVETVRDYIQSQHEMASLGNIYETNDYNEAVGTANSGDGTTGDLLEVLGYKDNISKLQWTFSNGVVNITCATATEGGDYEQGEEGKRAFEPCA